MKGIPQSTPIYVGLGDQDQASSWLNAGYEGPIQSIHLATPGLRFIAV
jgi:hypothetical protein